MSSSPEDDGLTRDTLEEVTETDERDLDITTVECHLLQTSKCPPAEAGDKEPDQEAQEERAASGGGEDDDRMEPQQLQVW